MTVRVLWATPRTVSTAFERMMIERGDHLVLDEPWSRAYYFGPQRRSARYPLTFPESTYAAVEEGVLASAAEGDVFVKDMAYHAAPGIGDDALAEMSHTFLIRDPAAALASLRRHWPDFTDDEAGYTAQLELFRRVQSVTGTAPAVIDSDALRSDPHRILGAWCDRVGLPRRPDALTWTAGMQPQWQLWRDWYANAAASTGFEPPAAATDPSPPDDPADTLATAIEAFDVLRRHAIV